MPAELKKTAKCPECADPLAAIIRTQSSDRLTVEYFHDIRPGAAKRKRRCKITTGSAKEAVRILRRDEGLHTRFTPAVVTSPAGRRRQ